MNLVVFSGYIGNIQYRRVNEEISDCEFSLAWSNKNKENEQITKWFSFTVAVVTTVLMTFYLYN